MVSRAKRTNSWQETLQNVAKAKKYMERFGVHEAHPDEYLERLSKQEEQDWEDLLRKI